MESILKWGPGHRPTARRLAVLLASLALLAPVPGLLLAPTGRAVRACEGFVSWSAGSYACVVAPGVTSLQYTVVGGPGGGIMQGGTIITPGGTAAQVKGMLSVTPGETLYLTVGGWGANGGSFPASGGGYSSIARVVDATTIPIVVAGGGGGAGQANAAARGGDGGTTGTSGGGDGGSDTHPAGYAGGTAPTGGAGGSAGYGPGGNGGTYPTSVNGTSNYSGGGGAFGGNGGGGLTAGGYAGGGGANTSGGGGGGGYGGGGGGTLASSGTSYGTGGGGGSSLVPSGGTATLAGTGSGVLLAARPDAPTMSAATASVNKVTLSWTAPALNGGATVTGYNLYQGTSSGGQATTPVNGTTLITATSFEVTGLTNGTTYYFTVAAKNDIGEGPASNEVSATPSAVVPGAPVMAIPTVAPGQVTLSWTAPSYQGGSAVTGYNVYQATTSGDQGTTPVNETPITDTTTTISGLTGGTTYYFTVAAVNEIGQGPVSNEVSATPTSTLPGAPTMRMPSAAPGQVTLSWTAPTYEGASAVTGYNVYLATTSGGQGTTPVNATLITGTSTTISGLTDGTTYYFTVKARNSVGFGSASPEASAVPGARYLYYRSGAGTIGRAELGGSNSVNNSFITGLGSDAPYGIAVDGQHIYWTVGMTTYSTTSGWIGRANLDGTGVDNHWIATGGSDWIAVDAGHIYWSNSYNGIGCTNTSGWGSIGRADLNGGDVRQCWIKTWSYESGTGGFNPQGVAVDPSYIYWSVEWSRPGDDPPAVMRAHIDGSGLERISLIAGAGEQPEGVAADADHAYWAKACTNRVVGYGALGRSDLNGANANPSLFGAMPCPIGIAVSGDDLYFSNYGTGKIGQLPADGSSSTPTWLTGVTGDWGVAVGVAVNPGATHFAVTVPATATAGTPISVTVTAKDALENTVNDYAGTVHFTSSDGTASLPADTTLTDGTGTFNVTLLTAGSQTITATDTVTSTLSGVSGSIPVAAPTTCASAGSTPITSIAELQAINAASTLANGRYQLMGHYCLTANLDAAGFGNFTPIGGPTLPFTGLLDGEGHTISNLTIDLPGSSWVGLFGLIASGGQIKNLRLLNATVHGGDATGGLAGENAKFVENGSGGTITNVYVTGTVTGTQNTGGLVGVNQTLSSITSSYSTATVSGTYNVGGLVGSNWGPITSGWSSGSVTGSGQNVGGLVGNHTSTATSVAMITRSWSSGIVSGASATGGLVGRNDNGTVDKSYSSASVTGSGSSTGGLVGYNNTISGGHATVQNSYSTGSVSGTGSIRGGLVGANGSGSYILVSYSTGAVSGSGTSVGGLVGYNNGPTTTTNSYWNRDTSGQNTSAGGTSRNDAEMRAQGNFGGFDFGVVWSIASGVTYPYFKWQAPVITTVAPAAGAPSVSSAANITVTFGTAMADASFGDATFYLMHAGGATHVASAISVSADHLTATLDPSANLAPATTYTVTVIGGSAGITDASGNALAVPGSGPYAGKWQWTFTTGPCANNGTPITTMNELQGIGGTTGPLSGNYCLAADLDAGGFPFTPIGTSSAPFYGSFDGQGHTISNLAISQASTANVGLFGYVGNGTGSGVISNVGLVNVSVSGGSQTGGLVGWLSGSYESPVVNILNSYVTGIVHGHDSTGGLVGFDQWGNVTNSFSTASVYGWASTGGLLGQNHATITTSYSTGAVQGTYMGTGGLVGSNYGPIANSYATGNVTGGNNWVGGLVGYTSASVSYSYSTGKVIQTAGYYAGGFAGWNLNPQNMHSYWDTETSWRGNGLGGFNGAVTGLAGLTDAAMRQQASFSGWDFTNVWTIDEGSTYPYLRWQSGPAGVVPSIFALPAGVTVTEGQLASFTAAAGGNPVPTLQWQQSTDGGTTWADIPGATTSPLSFTAELGQTGYGYRAVFGNASGTAISGAVTLTVTPGRTATAISAVSGSGDYGVTASVSATLMAGVTALSGKTISFTLNGSVVGSAETDVDGVATLDAVYLGSIGAGTHTGYIGASFAGDATYAASGPVTGDLVVAKAYQAALSITGPSTATFGDEDATISAAGGSGTGEITFSAGISTACSIVSGKLHVTSGTGDCTLVATKAADANHYLTVSQGWPVTIGKAAQAALSITAGQSFQYSSSGTFSPTTTGGSGTGAVTFTSSTASTCTAEGTTSVTIVAAGTCSLTAVKAGDDDYDDSAASASQDVTITVPLTETAISAVSGSGTYAGDGTVTATLMAGTSPVSGVMVSFSRNGMPLGSATTDGSGVATMPASMGSIPAGTHTGYVVAWFTGDETYAASGPVSGDLVVAKAGQSISFTAPADVHYGDTIYGLGATADSTLTVTYASLTTSVCTFEAPPAYGPVALRMAPVGPQLRIVGVGDCTVRASQAGDANYEAAPVVDRTFTTQKAPLSVTADADTTTADVDHFSRLYGETNPIFDVRYAGFVNMEGPEDLGGTLGYDTTATSTSDVGAYAVTPAGLTSSNYEITFVAGVLDIGKASQATLTIIGPSTATYGDADATISTSGGSGTGDVTFAAGTSSACSIVSGKLHVVSGTGTCSLTATRAGDTNHDPATSAAYPVTIGKAALSVTADADPTTAAIDHFAKAFGASLPAFTVRYAGFVNSETADMLGGTLGFETTATSTSDVGEYAVTPSGLTSSNYDISFAAGVLDIGKAGQTITFTSAIPESPTYGGSYSVSATGGGSGNPVTFAVSSASSLVCSISGSTVTFIGAGDCTVNANQAGSANYDAATPATQSFTVGKALLSVTADADPTTAAIDHFTRAHDAADPAFTVRFAGFVNGDDATDLDGLLDFDTESVASSPVGAYDVTPLGLTSSAYEITFVAGVLDIGIAGQSISFTAPTGVRYGDANRDLGATATSGLPVSYATSTESVCIIVGDELHVEAAGSCTVTASQGGNTDHEAALPVSVTFTIGKASQAITFAELPDRTYGDPDFTVSATASSGLTVHFHASGSCTIDGATVHLTGAGSCTITAHQDGDLNYDAASAVVRTFDTGPAVGTVAYIGQTLFVTSGPKSTTAQVRLTASVVATAGDISTARVTFVDDVTHTVLARGVRVSPVTGASTPTGTATVTVTLGSGKFGAQGYLVRVVLDTASGSSYENEEQLDDPTSLAYATLSVIVPGGTNTAKGDADVTPVAAAGEYGAATGVHYTIGLKYNKGGSSPQGQIFLTFDLDGYRYYVKSNSISSITCATQSSPCREMTIYTKASIYRVDGSGVTTSVDGNVTLRVDVHDAGGTATGDAIGFTVLSSKTGLLYWSNNWAYDADARAWRTMLQAVSAAGGVAVQTN